MKKPNVSDMTIVETVDVKKAGGGIVVVPATDEIHRLKRRLTALEERQGAMETLHYKGINPEAHNYPEPVHNEPTPLSCCEGCVDFPCTRSEISGFLIENSLSKLHPKPSCFLGKATCGECRNAYWQGEEYNGLCGKATTVGCWIRRTSPRCTKDFEAIQ